MKFTIDRKTWLRGEDYRHSFLHRASDGKMCCLGQVCQQLGVPIAVLNQVDIPAALSSSTKVFHLPSWITSQHPTSSVMRAMSANDNQIIDDDAREKMLKAIFAKEGNELEFV